MNARMEKLLLKMREENARAAAPKPGRAVPKVKSAKKVKPRVAALAPAEADYRHLDQCNIIDDVVMKMTREELADPANIVRLMNALVLDELVRYRKFGVFEMISNRTLDSIIDLQKTSNAKMARILCHSIIDSFESSNLNDGDADGSSGRRLRAMETAIEGRLQ